MKYIAIAILLLVAVGARAEQESNELPMYGGTHDPQVAQNKESSQEVAKLGWKYFYAGDLSTAMKRFNQAWMFDRSNPGAYWGFGLIMGRRGVDGDSEKDIRESIRFLKMAHDLSPKNGRILGDMAFSYTVLGQYLKTQSRDAADSFSEAERLFKEAYALDSGYPPIIANWSVLKFYTGDYPAAKKLLSDAKAKGYKPDPAFEKELAEKLK
ncbi:MAG: hypothetical protein ABIP97_05450 [Chthoniobacterales bacterium]